MGSAEVKANGADGSVVLASGWLVMVTVGGVVSIVQDQVAGVETLPARSVALTAKLCAPSARLVRSTGEVQADQVPPSVWHW
jgi:hypothetical protein